MSRLRRPTAAPAPKLTRRPATSGFTLIELIVASSVTVGIIGSVFLCFLSVAAPSAPWRSAARCCRTRASPFSAWPRTSRWRARSRASSRCSASTACAKSRTVAWASRRTTSTFATHNWRPQRVGERDFCEISYFVDRDPETGELCLFRRRDPTPDDKPLEGGTRELIAVGVRAFRLEYLGGLLWENKWGSLPETRGFSNDPTADMFANSMPEAVRVSLALGRPHDHRAGPAPVEEEPPLLVQQTIYLPLAPRFNDVLLDFGGEGFPGMSNIEDGMNNAMSGER